MPRCSFSVQLSQIEQLILTREIVLGGYKDLLEVNLYERLPTATLLVSIERTEIALARLTHQRSKMVARQR